MVVDQTVTRILQVLETSGGGGDGRATEELLPLVYDELRRLAGQWMAHERPGQTLQPTALVHEAYLRLVGAVGAEPKWDNRGHVFAAAARAMRRILVERARHKCADRHGGGWARVSLDHVEPASDGPEPQPEVMLALDDALGRLEAIDSRKAKVVLLRYFAGLTIEQTAEAMGLAATTVKDEWHFARAWLYGEMTRGES